MPSNPYTIQIKKRVLFNLIYGIIKIFLILLVIGIFFILTSPKTYDFRGFFFSMIAIIIVGIMGFILVVRIVWNLLYLNSIEYSLDNKSLTFKGGVISRFEKVIPYSKIQHAIIYESFWQRVLGLSSVSVETAREAGSARNTYGMIYGQQNAVQLRTGPFIPDLKKEDAEKLKDYIISVSNKKYKPVAGV